MILDRGPTPLYYQLKSVLEAKIRSQELKEKERLPSEAQLCQEFNVSRITVRQALAELMKAGLIYRDRGKGTFITEGAGLKKPTLKGSIEDLVAAAEGTRIEILSYKEVPVPRDLVQTLKIARSGRAYRLEILRFVANGPQGYSIIHFPPSLGRMISLDEIKEATEIISFVEDKLGTLAHGAHQTIDVGVADRLLAKYLSVRPGTPLLIIRREYFTRKGAIMFSAETYFRPDRFKYEIELARA
ncbi:MAG TPA: GntR family transcriptional regulator [Syntrophorhabdales bacterium]|nr:GntR family transcriptional regulator [Syntrophorhabdales bacterium]